MAVDLIFETHSISVDNERGVATGWLDGELSEEGRRLAAKLGERRRDVDVVYVSDLGRAVETAEIAFGGTDIPVRVTCASGSATTASSADASMRLDVELSESTCDTGGESSRHASLLASLASLVAVVRLREHVADRSCAWVFLAPSARSSYTVG